jgi:hypothetical protein
MFEVVDELTCQLFHGRWAEVVSYSRQGSWRCTRPGCRAQARQDDRLARARQRLHTPLVARIQAPQDKPAPSQRAA